ncbi:hypothetical protein MASR1M74_29880 [Lentimicrobium sp.]
MKKISLIMISILFLLSCQPTETEQTISIDNKYELTIPSFLTKVSNLNDDASLQYQHAWKEFYVIVIDETKSEVQTALEQNNLTDIYSNDIGGYSDLLMDGFEQVISVSRKSDIVDTIINNLPSKLITVKGSVEGIDAFYSLAFIEGQNRYYQIMAWTLASKEYQYQEKMRKLIYTFKEL